jgi:addiction module HigA family antidote
MATIKRPVAGWPIKGVTTHPGEILGEDFLKPMGISAHRLSLCTRVPATRISEILHGRRSITPDTALRLARFFGTSAEFWINLQANFELSRTRQESLAAIEREVQPLSLVG